MVPFDSQDLKGVVYVWIGGRAEHEDATLAEKIAYKMFKVNIRRFILSAFRQLQIIKSIFLTVDFKQCKMILKYCNLMYLQDNYTIQMISEGEEPENFFWVGIGGKRPYDKVSLCLHA